MVEGVLHRPRLVPHRRHLLRPWRGPHTAALGVNLKDLFLFRLFKKARTLYLS